LAVKQERTFLQPDAIPFSPPCLLNDFPSQERTRILFLLVVNKPYTALFKLKPGVIKGTDEYRNLIGCKRALRAICSYQRKHV
jgi:hypothetical protein